MRGDMILYHWKILITAQRLPLQPHTRQKGCTNSADGVKNRSMAFCWRDGGDSISNWITVGMSATIEACQRINVLRP